MERIDLQVNGMHCGNCENAIGKALAALDGVRDVKADHASGRVTVEADGPLDADALARAITEAGYELVPA